MNLFNETVPTNQESNNNKKLTSFLRDIATLIEKNEIDKKQLQSVGEFYISWKYQEVNKDSVSKDSDEDMIKFLVLGWYLYKILHVNDMGTEPL